MRFLAARIADVPTERAVPVVAFEGSFVHGKSTCLVFEELSSSPAGMEASRFCDFYGS